MRDLTRMLSVGCLVFALGACEGEEKRSEVSEVSDIKIGVVYKSEGISYDEKMKLGDIDMIAGLPGYVKFGYDNDQGKVWIEVGLMRVNGNEVIIKGRARDLNLSREQIERVVGIINREKDDGDNELVRLYGRIESSDRGWISYAINGIESDGEYVRLRE